MQSANSIADKNAGAIDASKTIGWRPPNRGDWQSPLCDSPGRRAMLARAKLPFLDVEQIGGLSFPQAASAWFARLSRMPRSPSPDAVSSAGQNQVQMHMHQRGRSLHDAFDNRAAQALPSARDDRAAEIGFNRKIIRIRASIPYWPNQPVNSRPLSVRAPGGRDDQAL